MQNSANVLSRLRKIEGQVKGIQKMISDDRSCIEVINQLVAVSRAIDKVSFMVASSSMKDCVTQSLAEGNNPEDAIDGALKLIMSLARQGA